MASPLQPDYNSTLSEQYGACSFQIHSDLHFERNVDEYRTYDIPGRARFLLLPGDIGRVTGTRRNQDGSRLDHKQEYADFIRRMSMKFDAVFYCPGNGEYMGSGDAAKTVEEFKDIQNLNEAAGRRTTRGFEGDYLDLETTHGVPITILGMTLWSKIRDDAPRGTADGFSGNSKAAHNARYEEQIALLRRGVQFVRQNRPHQRIIIMTHHAPTLRGTAQPGREYKSGPTNTNKFSGYQNDLLGGEGIEGLRKDDVWVFGHTHYSCDFVQDDVRVVANQRGGARNDGNLANTKYEKDGKVIHINVT